MAVPAVERRIVSVLVADMAGSTPIAEALGPERSKFLMDEVVRIMTTQVRRFDGTVAQLVGDEILALFGAPLAHEDDSERAVRAALAIQRALARYAEEVEAAYGVRLAARVGVNTGPVVVATEGEDDGAVRWNALGDTVNVASRLQALAQPGEVAIGTTTARQVEECFQLEPLGDPSRVHDVGDQDGDDPPLACHHGHTESYIGAPRARGSRSRTCLPPENAGDFRSTLANQSNGGSYGLSEQSRVG